MRTEEDKVEALQRAIAAFASPCDFIIADRRGSWRHRSILWLEAEGYVTTELYEFDEQSSELRARPTNKMREAVAALEEKG